MAESEMKVSRAIWARGVALLLLVGVVGHVFYWYWPRRRASVPSPTSSVANLVLREAGSEIRMWMPFPHQNLGYLEHRFGDLDSIGRALQELTGASQPFELPSFGPFRVPPASEMAFATDRAATGFVAVARVYPLAAWLFRAAGLLAGNPWMRGGDLMLGGREVRVEWRGSLWIARTGDEELDLKTGRVGVGRSVMLLRLTSLPGPISSGLFRLLADGPRMVLTSSLSGGPYSPPGIESLRLEEVMLGWIRISGSGDSRVLQSLMALANGPKRRSDLPALLIAETVGADPWELPGERVLEAIGAQVFETSVGSWDLRSYDSESLRQGEDLVVGLAAFASRVSSEQVLTVGYLDLVGAFQVALGVGEAMGQVPIFGEKGARKWLAFARILEGMSGISRVLLWVAEPDRLELQFWPVGAD